LREFVNWSLYEEGRREGGGRREEGGGEEEEGRRRKEEGGRRREEGRMRGENEEGSGAPFLLLPLARPRMEKNSGTGKFRENGKIGKIGKNGKSCGIKFGPGKSKNPKCFLFLPHMRFCRYRWTGHPKKNCRKSDFGTRVEICKNSGTGKKKIEFLWIPNFSENYSTIFQFLMNS
jgi:hypothetical protein